jgi:putative redox protein
MRGDPMTPGRISVTHREELQFRAQVGVHELTLDQPGLAGGDDAGPSPLDLIGAALGGCVALYVYQFLETRKQPTEGLRVEVEQFTARDPHRIVRFGVRIALPDDVPPVYTPMIEAVARVCPAYNTLARSADVVITVESPAVHAQLSS